MSHIYIDDEKQMCTLAYFRQECVTFRKMMGDKSFWAKPIDQRELAQKALGVVYVNLSNEDNSALSEADNQAAINLYEVTMNEYNRRERMLLFDGKANFKTRDEMQRATSSRLGISGQWDDMPH
jgi:hypothetical protein